MPFPVFLLAIASTAWYPAVGPTIVAAVLSAVALDYFFLEPRSSLALTAVEVPYYVSFLLLASMLAIRKRREEQIRSLNEQLKKRTAEAEAVNKELEAFAYSISRHLRAPQLIDDLLAFSRIGRAETRETTFSLREVVNEVIDDTRANTTERNTTWRIGNLPDLYGDRSMIRLVFVNLIANAIKFTRTQTRGEIEIGSFEDRQRGTVVYVKDNGVGFDMKYSRELFGLFQRLHRVEEFEGAGIGLATVQRIIHRHGGSVWAEGSVNGGATIFLSLPTASKR